jgi:drug/metabolite transporter (DMT)-like permease
MNRTSWSTFALLNAAALWGLATTGTKYALGGFGPVTLLAVELLAATCALWLGLCVRGYRLPRSWRTIVVLGLLEPAGAYLGETLGLTRTSASNGAVLSGLESTFVVVLAAIFLHERAQPRVLVAVGIGLLGLVTMEQASWLTGVGFGDSLVVCGMLSAAAYTIVARGLDDSSDALVVTAHQFAIATLAVAPLAVTAWASGIEAVPTHVPANYWLTAAAVGIGGFGASFVLYNKAITHTDASTAAVIINLIPAFGLAGAIVCLGEELTAERLVGAALIAGSVALFTCTRPKRRRAQSVRRDSDACTNAHPGADFSTDRPISHGQPEAAYAVPRGRS